MSCRLSCFHHFWSTAAVALAIGAALINVRVALAQDRPVASRPQLTIPVPPPATLPTVPAETQPDSPPTTEPATTAPAIILPEAIEIIDASFEAIGGKEAIDEIKNISMQATLVTPSGTFNLAVKSSPNGPFNLSREMPEQGTVHLGFDGTIGWMLSNVGNQLLDDDQVSDTRTQASVLCYWYMLKPQDYFKYMTTVEQVTFNEQDCYKVRLSDKPEYGHEVFAFYGVENKIMQGVELAQDSHGHAGDLSINFVFEDWKYVGEVSLFHKASAGKTGGTSTQRAVFTYTEVEVNALDEAAFEQPDIVKDLIAQKNGTATTQPSTQPATQPETQPATMPESPATIPDEP